MQKKMDDRRLVSDASGQICDKTVSADLLNLHGYVQHTVGLSEVEPFKEKEAAARAQGKQQQKGIWDLLKSIAVTYAVCSMYAIAMHDMLKRMQVPSSRPLSLLNYAQCFLGTRVNYERCLCDSRCTSCRATRCGRRKRVKPVSQRGRSAPS